MYIDIHTHQRKLTNNTVLNVIVGQDTILTENLFSLGIHPWYIENVETQLHTLKIELEKKNPNLLFIGECGLDKLRGADYLTQENAFRSQIKLSEVYEKPLVVHCVKAYSELIKIRKELKPKQCWVVHGFNRKGTIADLLVNNGMYLSFGINYLRSKNGREVLMNTPLNKVFFETDNNSESSIEEVYILASEILKVDLQELKNQIKNNLWQIIG